MANIRISQLPAAPSAITGTELVPIVQNGQTVQTTVSAITQSPSQTQTFLTVGAQASLPNSRYIGGGLGIGSSDGGAQGLYSLYLNGTSGSLENASTGIIIKSGVNTVVSRLIATGTTGLSIANGDGISGNPTLSLTGLALSAATLSGSGIVSVVGGSYYQQVLLTGTTDQIDVTNGTGGSNPIFGISNNPTLPGNSAVLIPRGNTSQRISVPTTGMVRYNTQTEVFEGYTNTGWNSFSVTGGVTSFSAGTTGFTPTTATTGAVTLGGILNVTNGGTGVGTLTGYVYGNGTSVMTASTTIPTTALSGTITNAQLANSAITIGSTSVSLGGTITALTGTSISGSTNTLTNIGNTSLTNSSLTVGTTNIALGATSLTLGGLTTVTVTQDPVSALQLTTKQYVDAVAQGLDPKASCVAATTVNITLSGTQTIDGVALIAGDRCLVKNQTTTADNGIYVVAASTWTRATDMDTWAEVPGAFTFIEQGTTQADTGWVCTSNAGGTIGVTAITFVQFAGVGSYTAGTGLTLTGTQFSLTSPVTTALGGTGLTAGTSGGVLYFSSTSAISSSALLTLNALMVGGGAGSAPSTVTTGTGVITALGVNTGSAGAFVVNGGALGTPSSGTVTNLTGTASININGTVGATTANTGAFTYLSTSSTTNTTPVLSFNASNSPIAMGATISGSYLQAMLQNKSGTAGASTNYVLSNDLGTDSTYYGEFGMNSSVFSASTPSDFFSINNGIYFSGHDGDVTIGSGNGYKTYFAWGTVGQSAHVINAAGAIGLSTNLGTTPALSGTTGFGTSGQVLTSGGSAAAPTWTSLSSTAVTSITFGTTGLTPATATTGAVTVAGTLVVSNGGTGLTSLTAGRIPFGAGTSAFGNSANLFWDNATTRLGVGTNAPAVTVAISSTDAILIPNGTTAQRPTGAAGYLRFNSTTTQFEGYNGTAWSSVGGAAISNDTTTASNLYPLFAAATSGSATTVYTSDAKYLYKPSTGDLQASQVVASNGLVVNSNTVAASYSIPSGSSAMSAGPMTIASGQTVTVPSGSRWVVL